MKVNKSILKTMAVAITVGTATTLVTTSCAKLKSLTDNKPQHEQQQNMSEFDCPACGRG
jgi:predicted RNA-binding Zn-ribbon protein involved in translation (DUF1610 family)